jgi:hypothetical protein
LRSAFCSSLERSSKMVRALSDIFFIFIFLPLTVSPLLKVQQRKQTVYQ